MIFNPCPQSLFFTKNDSEDPRLGELAVPSTHDVKCTSEYALWGYNDDDGIAMNGGRVGAKEAPNSIRQFLYKMTPPPTFQAPQILLTDLGNLEAKNLSLEDRHQQALETATKIFKQSKKVISLGAGHDYGYPDAAAFLESQFSNAAGATSSSSRPIVINFDAHLDVRPTKNGFHSGTPFRRLLEKYKGRFDFYEVGLQKHCNSPFHWAWASQQGAQLISAEKIHREGLKNIFTNLFDGDQGRPTFISFDIDVMSSADAPGCSQSWPTGLLTAPTISALQLLFNTLDVRGIGIYEVSPALDSDSRTSKLAALLIWNFLFQTKEQNSPTAKATGSASRV